ncbi:DUF1015 domain-containing protein [Robertkochia solimangrovi]|uniref:DUF1015 domain-containing protein n=1 Tax=Robertkochia solimangrovi TaxID=2213046 RepID=UPI00117DF576|nr:DUF1015 domain-containing protein [Robertkochia solimangrovi]TRZ45383.1 DUF1015 domain-containing protein [Robertkochia solimangrovi]
MTRIRPFKAVRPEKDKVALVVSRSYEDYSREELEATLSFNPYSFLHIINPGYRYHHELNGKQRFKMVKNRYLEFREEQVLRQDEIPGFYIYEISDRFTRSYGILAAASIDDYRNDVIKKHESTLHEREVLFKNYLKTVGFNAEPVLLAYPDNESIDHLVDEVMVAEPEYNFSTNDRIQHKLWRIYDEERIRKIENAFNKVESMYIADGHHRSASSCLLEQEMSGESPGFGYFMSYLIPESQLRISDFNRMVKDLNGLTPEEFLIKLDEHFRIENRGITYYHPTKPHHFCMYLDGNFYSLYLRKTYEFSDELSKLDAQILIKTILEPILGIGDLRSDKRIAYGCGKDNVIRMKDQIDNGKYSVGFNLFPVTIDQLKAIADDGLTMPPKTTYIEPKLKSGLTIYEF